MTHPDESGTNGFEPGAVSLRAARKSDCRTIAALYRISSDGVVDCIWTKMAEPGEDLLDIGQRRYEREEGGSAIPTAPSRCSMNK